MAVVVLSVLGTAPAHAIGDGIIAATDAGDNVGRFIADVGGRTRLCTATLIAADTAMTAEHCIWDLRLSDISITFATRNIDSDDGETVRVVGWDRSTRDYRLQRDSIVVLQLDRAVPGVTPARVARKGASNTLYAKGTYVLAVGWGTINRDQNTRSRELRIAGMEVADPTSTSNSGAIRVKETGGGRPQDGDSGGPLFSYDDDGQPIVVGVYTGSGFYEGAQHFYMKTAIDPLLE